MSQGPRRLSAHRMALALALVSAGPPLVVHNGWPGLVLAIIGAAYAAYLLLGKRWPKLRRPVARRPRSRPAEPEASAGRSVPPVVFEHPTTSADAARPADSGSPPPPLVFEQPASADSGHSASSTVPEPPAPPAVPGRPVPPLVFEHPPTSAAREHPATSPPPKPAAHSEPLVTRQPAPRFRPEQTEERDA